jgi:hypothetical protein
MARIITLSVFLFLSFVGWVLEGECCRSRRPPGDLFSRCTLPLPPSPSRFVVAMLTPPSTPRAVAGVSALQGILDRAAQANLSVRRHPPAHAVHFMKLALRCSAACELLNVYRAKARRAPAA